MSDSIDHVTLGLSRVTSEYKSAPDFNAYLTALLVPMNNIETAGQAIEASIDIDTAVGTQLDLLGRLVGISRYVPNGYPLPFFGFTDTPEGLTYGDEVVGGGGKFYEENTNNLTTWSLGDTLYRQFLRARILRNNSTGTTENIIAVLKVIFPNDGIIVRDVAGQLRIQVGINRAATVSEIVTLSYNGIFPKPAGVAIEYLPYVDFVIYFGFNPSDATYGDDVVGGGGPFMEEQY